MEAMESGLLFQQCSFDILRKAGLYRARRLAGGWRRRAMRADRWVPGDLLAAVNSGVNGRLPSGWAKETEVRFAGDSPVEGAGFEPSGPPATVEFGAAGGARRDDAAIAKPGTPIVRALIASIAVRRRLAAGGAGAGFEPSVPRLR
jgi:hypothetical protein